MFLCNFFLLSGCERVCVREYVDAVWETTSEWNSVCSPTYKLIHQHDSGEILSKKLDNIVPSTLNGNEFSYRYLLVCE